MSAQLLFYSDATPITLERHKTVSLRALTDFSYTRGVNAVPVVAAEFAQVAGDMMIVFAGDENGMMPMVVLGLQDQQNLFLDPAGRWSGRYVPAFVRRYPFAFSMSSDGQTFTLCIDETYPGLNRDGEGSALFDEKGERTEYLSGILAFLEDYQAQYNATRAFCGRLIERGLMEPMHVEYKLADGSAAQMRGFHGVNREKLKALPAETLSAMMQGDELQLVYAHLQSLNNLDPLLNRMNPQ